MRGPVRTTHTHYNNTQPHTTHNNTQLHTTTHNNTTGTTPTTTRRSPRTSSASPIWRSSLTRARPSSRSTSSWACCRRARRTACRSRTGEAHFFHCFAGRFCARTKFVRAPTPAPKSQPSPPPPTTTNNTHNRTSKLAVKPTFKKTRNASNRPTPTAGSLTTPSRRSWTSTPPTSPST